MAKNVIKDFAEPIRASITQLESEISGLEQQLEGIEEIQAELRNKKKQVTVLTQTIARLNGEPATKSRPRGENLSDIQDHLTKHGGATVREIAEATGINVPSVRYTLGRNDQFIRDENNHWSVDC